MAGPVDLLFRCYLGVQTRDEVLWFDPHLPAEMTRIEVNLQYGSQRMGVTMTDRNSPRRRVTGTAMPSA